ncbi:MAG: LD-carboxypeptidase family protein [Herbinix sp.]|jgi:muramoyltetrapeptide carboxypeptidase LdcA involved in peptidoglycan recycling|nr:LD-carboxypeptidase family protein [Herbinix sp.]
MLKQGSYVGIACCSNGLLGSYQPVVEELIETLGSMGIISVCSDYLYSKKSVFSGSGSERANALMNFYEDNNIEAIFDISGGDIANGILEYLDYDLIRKNPKPFFGYSDLTTVINAMFKKTGNVSYLYQVRNLIYEDKEMQRKAFINSLFYGSPDLYDFKYKFLRGETMRGIVVGGNIRCLLKLAGTEYQPDWRNKILFLESLGGEVALMTTHLYQLKQMGVFEMVVGVLLGTFTIMEERDYQPTMEDLVLEIADQKMLPIAKTYEIGHSNHSKCIIIGKELIL